MDLPRKIQEAIDALLGSRGKSDPFLRRAVFERTRTGVGEIPVMHLGAQELCEWVEKIDNRPWTVTDEDCNKLREAGFSEDEIFELTVVSAAGAGVKRFEAGLRALEAADEEPTSQRSGSELNIAKS